MGENESHPEIASGIAKRFAQIAIVFTVQAVVLFWSAGTLSWVWAWVYLGICILSVVVNAFFFLRKSPDLIAERGEMKIRRTWDRVISSIYGSSLFLLVPLVGGLDERNGWSGDMGAFWQFAGAIILAAGLGVAGWAMMVNRYFSTAVRIQSDRGQTVCKTGPYRFVRHPGYVGMILQSLSTPVVLGSLWALLPGITAALSIAVRTSFEDRTLQEELPGYREYVQETRFRLLPGIW